MWGYFDLFFAFQSMLARLSWRDTTGKKRVKIMLRLYYKDGKNARPLVKMTNISDGNVKLVVVQS
jgi:hypothetical protein